VATSIRWVEDGREMKLVRANAGNPRGLAPVELYEVGADPRETKNLAATPSPRLEKGLKALDAMEIRAREGAARAKTDTLTAEQKRVLEQLGYMKKGE